MTPATDLDYFANLLVVELLDLRFTMAFSFARQTLEEHLDELEELSGLDRLELIRDHIDEETIAQLAYALAERFHQYEDFANGLPGVLFEHTACLQLIETMGWGVNELTGKDVVDGVAVAGEMVAVLSNGALHRPMVHLTGAGCSRLTMALDRVAQATDPRHSDQPSTAHPLAIAAMDVIAEAVQLSQSFDRTTIVADVRCAI